MIEADCIKWYINAFSICAEITLYNPKYKEKWMSKNDKEGII